MIPDSSISHTLCSRHLSNCFCAPFFVNDNSVLQLKPDMWSTTPTCHLTLWILMHVVDNMQQGYNTDNLYHATDVSVKLFFPHKN